MIKENATRMKQVRKAPIIDFVSKVTIPNNVISFGQGISFFPPPEVAVQAAEEILSQPSGYQYTTDNGRSDLRNIIAEKITREQGIHVNPDQQIMVTSGANQAFMNALLSITQINDEIIFLTPSYFNYIMAAQFIDCKPILVSTDENFQPILSKITEKITKKTKAIVTISPNNPTGSVYSPQTLKEINDVCKEHSLYHISDEVYEYFVYGETCNISPLRFDQTQTNTISLFSLSKAFSLSGYRIGYMVYPKKLHDDMIKAQDTIGICAPGPSQAAALACIPLGQSYCSQFFDVLHKNRLLVKEMISNIDGIRVPFTNGAYYFFITLTSSLSSFEACTRLIEDFGVLVLPGSLFDEQTCSFRLSYGNCRSEDIKEGLHRLQNGLQAIL